MPRPNRIRHALRGYLRSPQRFSNGAARAATACFFALGLSAATYSQQITCPVATDTTNSGTASNATSGCAINSGVTLTNNGTFQNLAGGSLQNGGAIDNNSAAVFTNAGWLINLSGGTLINNSFLSHGFENQAGGTITNAGSITNNVALQNDSGAMFINGSGGLLTVNGTVFNNGAMVNQSTATIVINNTSFLNFAGATFTNQAGGLLSNQLTTSVVDNFGLLTNKGALTNAGFIENESGGTLLNASGGMISGGGAIENDSGATLTNTGQIVLDQFTSAIFNFGTFANSSGGALTLDLAPFTNFGIFTNSGTIINDSEIVNNSNSAATFINNGTIDDNIGDIVNDVSGALINNKILNVSNGTVQSQLTNNGTMANNGVITINVAGFFTNNSEFDNNAGATLTNVSGVILNNSRFNNDGTLTDNNDFFNISTVVNSGMFTSKGEFTNQGMISNFGTMSFSRPTKAFLFTTNQGSITNAGTVNIQAGAALNNAAGSSYIQTAGQTIVDGTINSVPAVQIVGGNLSGTGMINGDVNNIGGILQPGDAPGTLTINGAYVQGPAGTLTIDLDGAEAGAFSVLDVSGLASLGGTVDFLAENSFAPGAGDDFTFLSFGSLSGNFSDINFTNWVCPAGDTCAEVVGTQSLSLDITGPTGGGTTPTPEPSGLSLLAIGILSLGIFSRWKRGSTIA